jgi:adhesin/invasin
MAVAACGSGNPGPSRVATTLEVVAGGNQTASVGTALPIKVVVKTSDAQGVLGGVVVSATVESQGGGSTSPTSVTTAANGQAEFTWTLGSKQGSQTLTLRSGTLTPVSVSATGADRRRVDAGPGLGHLQFTVVTRAVTAIPSVRVTDAFGNPIQGTPITFETTVAGSVLTGTQATTNAAGVATVGSWTIGPDAISYQIRAVVTSGPAQGQAVAFEARGAPATAGGGGG